MVRLNETDHFGIDPVLQGLQNIIIINVAAVLQENRELSLGISLGLDELHLLVERAPSSHVYKIGHGHVSARLRRERGEQSRDQKPHGVKMVS